MLVPKSGKFSWQSGGDGGCFAFVWLRGLFGVLFLVLIGFNINTYIKHRGMVKITVEVLPSDSTLLLDNKKVSPGDVYMTAEEFAELKSGQHS